MKSQETPHQHFNRSDTKTPKNMFESLFFVFVFLKKDDIIVLLFVQTEAPLQWAVLQTGLLSTREHINECHSCRVWNWGHQEVQT